MSDAAEIIIVQFIITETEHRAIGNHMKHISLEPDTTIEIPLYPDIDGNFPDEKIIERSTVPSVHDRIVLNVSSPSMFMFRPENPDGSAMLIIPGGGFEKVVIDKEGADIAKWLVSIGVTAFVLKYRLPSPGLPVAPLVSVNDAIRAMEIIRERTGLYGIDPDRIGATGFSAGAYIAARMSCCPGSSDAGRNTSDGKPPVSPALIVLIYPLVTFFKTYTHPGSWDILVGRDGGEIREKNLSIECNLAEKITPPVFICHTQDDPSVNVENSLLLYRSLREKCARAEMHLFHEGGHGFGIRKAAGLPVGKWTLLCESWMRRNGFLT
jgi:acetyl esterase/lipase